MKGCPSDITFIQVSNIFTHKYSLLYILRYSKNSRFHNLFDLAMVLSPQNGCSNRKHNLSKNFLEDLTQGLTWRSCAAYFSSIGPRSTPKGSVEIPRAQWKSSTGHGLIDGRDDLRRISGDRFHISLGMGIFQMSGWDGNIAMRL